MNKLLLGLGLILLLLVLVVLSGGRKLDEGEINSLEGIFAREHLENVKIHPGTLGAKIIINTIGLGNAGAVTLGQNIFVAGKNFSLPLLAHEVEHTYQYKKLGWVRFVTSYLNQYFRGGYESVSFEKEAFAVESNFLMR